MTRTAVLQREFTRKTMHDELCMLAVESLDASL